KTGGKQYEVRVGDTLKVEKLETNIGDKVVFDALFVSDGEGKISIGKDANKVKVNTEVFSHGKAEKILVYKYRPKKRTRRKYGHRQPFTELKIIEIK
ncbi:MAG: 50S ribosomal protein L21, partial [Clostridia bacterium]|nr:50S ribosomal protein L21 [Clostridia bacterium]